ncbi:MAG: hypothetical protein GTO45_19555, partial [Candidatus Aminicenantes bacterium]|nr:hypothetical protein [Candidatus Aminicenantes bacterium]NIM80990.1 hypothetical protein [Candidatus Aminicenantes bacterium]NIN20367.1 hypothetical protein [Candidatus Aminicenantes bacterium]NIN44140.1 hypothetical protein [Candidatus Aminicenantes bacterium]NIN86958.1 hypothetical protein [Candidatus Aminicenantes bacterium]
MRNKAIVILSFILLAVFSVRVYGDIPQPERDALIELYNSTNGDSWKDNSGWKAEPLHTDGFAMPGTEEDWHGITLSGDHVTEISLVNNNLAGPIPPELGDLSNLATLDLGYNQLTGEIPVALGSLKETLTYLSLRDNQLSGEIPAALGNLENLTYLNLHINQLTKIPTELDKLTNLTYLNLHSNQLNGIPPGLEWGKLSKLEYLWLNNNPLACNIPPGLGNLSSLIDLDLNSCQLTGSIPQELENLTKLQELKLNKNHLTGSIPEELGNLSNLTKLYLQSNNLKGPIPTSLIYLTGLSETDIGYNALYTKNTGLITFLDTKDPDWKDTQTIAPEGVNAEAINSTTIKVSWTPILYTGDTGGYRVF